MSVDLFGQVATADTGDRADFDFYETPAWMTRSLLHFAGDIITPKHAVLECCSGRDAITSVLRQRGHVVWTNDIDARHPSMTHEDATTARYWSGIGAPVIEKPTQSVMPDWVITNPPFNVAFPILVGAFEAATEGVALLVRKTFLEPTEERGAWLAAHPPTRIIGQPRYSFRGAGSDMVACDWMIWERDPLQLQPAIYIDHQAKSRRAS